MEPHVLIFPLPLQGPINCNLKLAELLSHAGIHVTLLNTDHMHRRLLRHTDVQSRFSRYPNFHFLTLPDGLPDDHPRSADLFLELLDSIEAVTKPMLRDYVVGRGDTGDQSSEAPPVTCVIADGMYSWAVEMAEEVKVPLIYFDTIGPCSLWIYMCLPKLILEGEVPIKGIDLDATITCVPGMEHVLRRRDLPHFCRGDFIGIQPYLKAGQQIPRAQGLILNTFEYLDSRTLPQIRALCPNLYSIGPIHTHLQARIHPQRASSNSLREEDESCLAWLDMQPSKSVIYVSFGSLTNATQAQFIELWHGLVNSEQRFLWVRRPGFVIDEETTKHGTDTDTDTDNTTDVFDLATEKGYIVDWAPQERVLSHSAIGGFFMHGGWNSTLESIVEGVPMVCWPSYVDQQVNSRFVDEVWKIGIDIKDSFDRVSIEKSVRRILEVRKEEFEQSSQIMAKMAKESICKGGSSYEDLNNLIANMRSMSQTKPNLA